MEDIKEEINLCDKITTINTQNIIVVNGKVMTVKEFKEIKGGK